MLPEPKRDENCVGLHFVQTGYAQRDSFIQYGACEKKIFSAIPLIHCLGMQDFLRHAFEYFSPANKKKQKEVPQWQRRRRRRFKFPPNSTQDEAQKNHNNQQHHQAEALDKKNTSKQSLIPVYSENGGAIIGYVAKPDGPSTPSPSVVAPPVASTNQNPDLGW